jgi:hypothetical protein
MLRIPHVRCRNRWSMNGGVSPCTRYIHVCVTHGRLWRVVSHRSRKYRAVPIARDIARYLSSLNRLYLFSSVFSTGNRNAVIMARLSDCRNLSIARTRPSNRRVCHPACSMARLRYDISKSQPSRNERKEREEKKEWKNSQDKRTLRSRIPRTFPRESSRCWAWRDP